MLRSFTFKHSLPLTRVYSKSRAHSTLPTSSLLGTLPTTQSSVVSKLSFFNSVTGDGSKISTYRVLDEQGIPIEGAEVPEVCALFHPRMDPLTLKFIRSVNRLRGACGLPLQ
jgi:2-oxoisovalerate dehydrogenase E1 component alpha subunit